ncbi:MAG: hypothetical protein ACOH2K_12620 [Burkholderiaceae bacterium]
MSKVFSKTDQGQEEIKTHAGGLKQRVRQVLIFVDGKRDITALRKMLPADDIEQTLQALQEQGYIAATEITEDPASGPAQATPIGTVFRELPPKPATKELELARNFMVNTLVRFTGPYATLSLVEKVYAAQSHAEIRMQFDHWVDAIVKAHAGKQRTDTLRISLLEII